jgi:hypothetical protein
MERADNDLFNISERIKEIDCDYEIYRNHYCGRYEVWRHSHLSFVIPFEELDERTLAYARKTRRENIDEIEREINEGNAKVEREIREQLDIKKAKLKDILLYENSKEY